MKIQRTERGMTLLELLVGLTMVAILVGLAVPSMREFLNKNSVQSDQRTMLADFSSARAKAIESNDLVSVCGRVASGYTCNSSDDWSNGWIVFLDNGGPTLTGTKNNGLIDGDEEIVKINQYEGANTILLLDTAGGTDVSSFGYDQRGYMNSELTDEQLTFTVCDPQDNSKYARAIFVELTGRSKASTDTDSSGVHEDLSGGDLSC